MASHTSHNEDTPATGHVHHGPSLLVYGIIYAALMVLMGLTIAASYIRSADLPFGATGSVIVALIIATIKATLVVLYFMGVKYQTNLTRLWAALGFIWFVLLFGILGDYVTRQWIHLPQGW